MASYHYVADFFVADAAEEDYAVLAGRGEDEVLREGVQGLF